MLAAVVSLAACDQVGVEPTGQAAADNIFLEDGAYRSYLAKLYAGLNVTGQSGPFGDADIQGIDEGFSQYVRLWWQMQELPTDEAVIAFSDGAVQELNTNSWGPTNGFTSAMYYRISFQATQANEFLRQSTPDLLDERNVDQSVRNRMPQWRAEARFLRALSYWHGVDLFGNIPIVTQDNVRGGEPPEQNSRQEVFDFVESELRAIAGLGDDTGDEVLPPIGEAEYGRADRGAALMVLANLYLNAEVYTGTARYADAVDVTERIIDSQAYSLQTQGSSEYSAYQRLFLADNNTVNGFIFAIPHEGQSTQHFGGTQFLTHAAVGGSMSPGEYGIDVGYQGLRTTPEGVALFDDANDDRRIFFTTGQSLEIPELLDFQDGYAVPKYINKDANGNDGSNLTFPDTDYPMFRLAEAYLIYAEATLRSNAGSRSRALSLVNALRDRAGVSAISDGELTLDFLLDERGRELFWCARRRTDLVRYDKFYSSDDADHWSWKGGSQDGQSLGEAFPDEMEGTRNLYPLPANEIQVNPNLEQNPGY
jgi:hypothetical protein